MTRPALVPSCSSPRRCPNWRDSGLTCPPTPCSKGIIQKYFHFFCNFAPPIMWERGNEQSDLQTPRQRNAGIQRRQPGSAWVGGQFSTFRGAKPRYGYFHPYTKLAHPIFKSVEISDSVDNLNNHDAASRNQYAVAGGLCAAESLRGGHEPAAFCRAHRAASAGNCGAKRIFKPVRVGNPPRNYSWAQT